MVKPHLLIVLLTAISLQLAFSSSASAQKVHYLNKGWDQNRREQFYNTPQGSRLMPNSWFLALETAKSETLFSSKENLAEYGWSYSTSGQLPVGFVEDPVELQTGKWIGLTCAACHTADISHKGKRYRVDGGASKVNFQAFTEDLAASVTQTAMDQSKFQRFIRRLTPEDAETAKDLFPEFAVFLRGQTELMSSPRAPGAGRIDALTQIINSMSVLDLNIPANQVAPVAPVDIPFIWLSPRLHFVQWNPVASNPMARNIGEVLGVFGHANLQLSTQSSVANRSQRLDQWKESAKASFADSKISLDYGELLSSAMNKPSPRKSISLIPAVDLVDPLQTSAMVNNLYQLEKWVGELEPPEWNEQFGKIDLELAKKGKELFKRDCLQCHNMPPFRMTRKEDNIIGKQFIEITRINYKAVGTDPLYVESLVHRLSKSGDLSPLLEGEVVPAAKMFLSTVGAVTQAALKRAGLSQNEILEYSDYRFYPSEDGKPPKPYVADSITDMKAGPLLGIWATGPFLHNGSVPTIYELLSPVSKRRSSFHIGSIELDTQRLGFIDDGTGTLFDTSIPGNSNAGHEYPVNGYTPSQRWAVIEYLKAPKLLVQDEETEGDQ